MKRLVISAVVLLLAVALAACSAGTSSGSSTTGESLSSPDSLQPESQPTTPTSPATDPEYIAMTYEPDDFREGFPTDARYTDEADIADLRELLDSLDIKNIKRLIAVTMPYDGRKAISMTAEQAGELLDKLKLGTPTIMSEPQNPNTGGAFDVYLETTESTIIISFNGSHYGLNWKGAPRPLIFSGEGCSTEMYEAWGFVSDLFDTSNEK